MTKPPITALSAALGSGADGRDDEYRDAIENFVGTVRMPVGIIGPLRVRGAGGIRDFHVPLATTEGTLVASYGRGAGLVSAAGGCSARVVSETVARAPGFVFNSIEDATRFASWIGCQRDTLAGIAASTSRYARLTEVRPVVSANLVHVILSFTTGEAAGQNMVTIATQAIMSHVRDVSPVRARADYVEANLSGDKKASAASHLVGRGRAASADVEVPAALLSARLRASAAQIEQFFTISSVGAARGGTIGVQGHYANGLAALFLACGQDVACVAESAAGVTRLEARPDGSLYASVTIPSLVVGTVGGGTGLPGQRACLDVLGIRGPGSANAFAELCAAVVLGGEISIAGAIVADEFTHAHRQWREGRAEVSARRLTGRVPRAATACVAGGVG